MRLARAIAALFLFLPPAPAQWTAAAYLGGAHINQSSLTISQPVLATSLSIRPVSYAVKPFQSPLYYGYRAGYFFSRHFGFEGEFIHLKAYAVTDKAAQFSGLLQGAPVNQIQPLSSVVERFNITHGVNLLTWNLVARKMFGRGDPAPRFVLVGRVGGGITIPHPENEVFGVSNAEHYQIGSPVLQLAAGFGFRLWSRIYALSEVKYTRVDETVSIAQGTGSSLLSCPHVIIGLGWQL